MHRWTLPLLLIVAAAGACGPAWHPARPTAFTRLHGVIDQLELDIHASDKERSGRIQETVGQMRELGDIARERFIFSNAVARLWTRLYQDLEGLEKAIESDLQGIEYTEKRLQLEITRMRQARTSFEERFSVALAGLREILCPGNPKAAVCGSAPEPEKTP